MDDVAIEAPTAKSICNKLLSSSWCKQLVQTVGANSRCKKSFSQADEYMQHSLSGWDTGESPRNSVCFACLLGCSVDTDGAGEFCHLRVGCRLDVVPSETDELPSPSPASSSSCAVRGRPDRMVYPTSQLVDPTLAPRDGHPVKHTGVR